MSSTQPLADGPTTTGGGTTADAVTPPPSIPALEAEIAVRRDRLAEDHAQLPLRGQPGTILHRQTEAAKARFADVATTPEGDLRVERIAAVVAEYRCGLIVDAMSTFGLLPLSAAEIPYDAVIASSNKCLEGVPGLAFVIARRTALEWWPTAAIRGNSVGWIVVPRPGLGSQPACHGPPIVVQAGDHRQPGPRASAPTPAGVPV